MSRTPPGRKRHPGPDLGLAPGERGFASWLRSSVTEAEAEAKHQGTLSAKEWLAHTERLLSEPVKTKRRRAG